MAEKFDIEDIDSLTLDSLKAEEPARPHYVDNVKLSASLSEWRIKCNAAAANGDEKRPKMPEFVGLCILKISRNIATRFNYNRYSYKEEMIEDAIENCCAYLHNFDPFAITRSGKPNAFSYITRIVMNTFGNRIQMEQRQEYYKLKLFEMAGGFAALGDDMDNVDTMATLEESGFTQDYMTRIAEYEAKMEVTRVKNAEKARAAAPPQARSIFDEFFAAEEPDMSEEALEV